jgi:predicted DNA-binding transcriptional regulator AlpA
VAERLGLRPQTLEKWRFRQPPEGPPYVKLGRSRVVYRVEDVERWMDANTIDPAKVIQAADQTVVEGATVTRVRLGTSERSNR